MKNEYHHRARRRWPCEIKSWGKVRLILCRIYVPSLPNRTYTSRCIRLSAYHICGIFRMNPFMAFRAYYQSFSSPLAFRQFSFVPHTLYTFPSRISCRIIGCDSSSLDTFTYRLLKAESYKYRVTNLYRACGDIRAHTVYKHLYETCLYAYICGWY